MELLTRHTADISATNEALIRIGNWLGIVNYEVEEITQEQEIQIKEEFRKLLTRLGYKEKCIAIESPESDTKVICKFENKKDVAMIEFSKSKTNKKLGELHITTNTSTSTYECHFNEGKLTVIYLIRKCLEGQPLEIRTFALLGTYCATIQSAQEDLQVIIVPNLPTRYPPNYHEYINIPVLEKVLQSITFPIKLEQLYLQICDTLDEKVKQTYSIEINGYREKGLIYQLSDFKGDLKIVEPEANKTPNLGGGKGEPRTRKNDDMIYHEYLNFDKK